MDGRKDENWFFFNISKTSAKIKKFAKYTLFYKQHFYKQCQAEIGKKIKQKLSNSLRLNCHFLKIIRFLHPRYYPKILGDILKNVQKHRRLFWWGYMINDNENEAENEK